MTTHLLSGLFGFLKSPAALQQTAVTRAPPRAPRRAVTESEVSALYQRPDSFTDLLPWREYDSETKVFVLEDGISVGAYFELQPAGTEARPDSWMRALRDNLQNALRAIPEVSGSPWVLQLYLQDEPDLGFLIPLLRDYAVPTARGTQFTEHYLHALDEHLQSISRPGGLFMDAAITGTAWRGQVRRVRAVLYRRRSRREGRNEGGAVSELNEAAARLTHALQAGGIKIQRRGGEEFYNWMVGWFNPGTPLKTLLAQAPYTGDQVDDGDGPAPYGADFAERMLFNRPRSDATTGTWWLDGLPHQALTVQGLRRVPLIGHITAERTVGDHTFALFDRAPENTIMAMTIVITPQDEMVAHLERIKKSAVGDSAEAQLALTEAEIALRENAMGNALYPVEMTWYLRAADEDSLRYQASMMKSKLSNNDLQIVDERGDLLNLDSYVRNLPMAYDPALEKSAWTARRRSRLMYARHITNLLPVYGRSTGTGNPGFLFFSRSAEPLTFDPLNRVDRKKNAHLLLLGPTGSGKTATLVYVLQQMMAVHRPRLFLIDAGNCFGLLGQHFASLGLTVNHLDLMPGTDVSLPPFAAALSLLDDQDADPASGLDDEGADPEPPARGDKSNESDKRDMLGEMEIAARIMITGGEEREDARMTRADRLLIRKAILGAARAVREAGRKQVITMDVSTALRTLAADEEGGRRERGNELADGLELFCDGLAGHFFNRPGVPWPEVDVTIVNMGIFAREGYQDMLTVAYIGLMNNIVSLAERCQYDGRPLIALTDEAHIVTTNPLLAPYVVKISKMSGRKYKLWLWLATQNLEDFPDAAKKMLNMAEWWLCLTMPKEEVEQIARFKSLTEEQRSLLLAARKEPGKYTEGVVLSDQLTALFRVVPPPLCLALAMTEGEEKAERWAIMKERRCTELEAVYVVAERIARSRS